VRAAEGRTLTAKTIKGQNLEKELNEQRCEVSWGGRKSDLILSFKKEGASAKKNSGTLSEGDIDNSFTATGSVILAGSRCSYDRAECYSAALLQGRTD
jgi:hypothetical protein